MDSWIHRLLLSDKNGKRREKRLQSLNVCGRNILSASLHTSSKAYYSSCNERLVGEAVL